MKISIGNMVDQLSIVNIKIYMQEDIKRDPGASDKEITDATRKTNTLNMQRNALIDEIDLELNEISEGKKQKLFGANKSYGKK